MARIRGCHRLTNFIPKHEISMSTDTPGKKLRRARGVTRRFFEKDFQFGFGLDVELENAGVVGFFNFVAQRFTNFFAGFAYAGKDDAIARNGNAGEVIEFARGDDIEATAVRGEQFEDGEIAIGFHGETESMRNGLQSGFEFVVGVDDGVLAIDIGRRAKLPG